MLNIMLCDDAIFMRKYLRKVIEDHGDRVVAEATNPDEVIEFYTKFEPDLVLLDIIMPRGEKAKDGVEALKQIIVEDPSANVVMCSSLGQDKLIKKAKKIGAKDFISKPFKPYQIIQILSRYS